MEIVRTQDTGTLQYEIFFNHDETEAIVYERYRDIDAAMEHLPYRPAYGAKGWQRRR